MKSSKFSIIFNVVLSVSVACLAVSNVILNKKIEQQEKAMMYTTVSTSETEFKLETFIQMISNQLPEEVERITEEKVKEMLKNLP